MHRIFLLSLFLVGSLLVNSQTTNTDPSHSFINITLPRTPESQGFEKYGNYPVNELTGSINITIPLFDLKSRFLDVPITLSYLPSGIKVNQEASWVGLGWDLNAGGRITMESRGAIDFLSDRLYSPGGLRTGMQQIFHRLGDSGTLGILTYACTCYGCYLNPAAAHAPGTPDDYSSVNAMAQFGLGEPDIYRANFMGNSLSFYFDKITGALSFLGEKSFFNIQLNKNSDSLILNWTITDNVGNKYFFSQQENTTIRLSANATLFGASAPSAWLLTKILHPTGDSILFSYVNYGNSYPAYNWSSSLSQISSGGITSNTVSTSVSSSLPASQTPVTQQPYYLTRIESNNVLVNFKVGNRNDLNGPGSKRLDSITIVDKFTNTIKEKISFSYDYFTANTAACYVPVDDDRNNPLRLRLSKLIVNDMNGLTPPYKFVYSNNNIPSKFSFDQDHWGYYNAAGNPMAYSNSTCSPINLIPKGVSVAYGTPSFVGNGLSRECNSSVIAAMSLQSIEYPTGGSSTFIYEPHQSSSITGGGLRIKTIKNYSLGKLAGTTDYTYSSGVYMGKIVYDNATYQVRACQPGIAGTGMPTDDEMDILSSNGAINDNDYLIAYPSVTITQSDANGKSNGYTTKTFNVSGPQNTGYNTGFATALPVWPHGIVADANGSVNWDLLNSSSVPYLYPQFSGYAPTPIKDLDGKLMQEQIFDAYGNLLKSVNHFYHQADYSQKFYDIKVRDNTIGSNNGCGGTSDFSLTTGARRFSMFVSPAKSFFTLEDSIIELTYSGSNFLKHKKTFKYNSYYQPTYEADYNSDNSQTITYTQTSAALTPNYNLAPLGDALLLASMKSAHIYDLPIEQTVIHRSTSGDSSVISSRVNIYKGTLPLKVYVMETAQPLTLRTQFVPAFYNYANYPNSPGGSSDSLKIDAHYSLYSAADYSPNNHIWTLHALESNSAYIWDEYYNNILAQCNNADSANVAFTSFETNAPGRWIYSSSAVVADSMSPTGNRSFLLSSGVGISRAGLSGATTYIVSYWSKSGSYNVTGSISIKQGKTINLWTYYEHTVSGTSVVTISGIGKIDELRLYPSVAQMISYTYSPLIGITSQCDADNRITYYFYDSIGRLKWIKDQDGNIIKTIQYHFQTIPGLQY